MLPPNHNLTDTILGTSSQRADLLQQEASNSRGARWVRKLASIALVLVIVGLLAAVVMGPSVAVNWIVTYLVPVGVLLTPLLGASWLLTRTIAKSPPPPFRDRMQ